MAKIPGTQLVSVRHSLHLTIQGVLSPRSVRALLAAAGGESLATRNRKNWEVCGSELGSQSGLECVLRGGPMGPALCLCPREVLFSQSVAFHSEGVLRTLPVSPTALTASSQP